MTANLPIDYEHRPVAVIGAGTLGRRIALMFAAHSADVKISDLSDEQRRAAVDYVAQTLPELTDQLNDAAPGTVSATAELAEAVRDAPRSSS
jgi:3-hydroxybutyryl-CoA dehydrogenase